jgi:UDP-N-acetylglucosamine 2-epimerase (non-hydrolysing)
MSNSIVFVVGTRPDALKLIPVYKKLKEIGYPCLLYATHQHRDLLDDVLTFFNVIPDSTAHIMQNNQTLAHITSSVLSSAYAFLSMQQPSMVVVQGDTSSSFAAALAAFYLSIPLAHVEAGLRTANIYAPFPEEANRRFIATISNLHFTPTPTNTLNLLHEGVHESTIFCVGNTIIDTLFAIKQKIDSGIISLSTTIKELIERCQHENKKLVLVTMHRRESFAHGINRVFEALVQSATQHQELIFFFPTHPNPHIQEAISQSQLPNTPNIICSSPIAYHDMIGILSSAAFVITDSGGIQEEATALGKNVIILRDTTERVESIWEQTALLSGTNKEKLVHAIDTLCIQTTTTTEKFMYGDGMASQRIAKILVDYGKLLLHHTSPSHLQPVQSVEKILTV